MKWPLLPVALVYSAGLLLAELLKPPLHWLFAASFILAIAALAFSRSRPLLIWPLLLCLGWTNLSYRSAILSPHDLRLLVPPAGEPATIRGRLVETPNQRVFLRDEKLVPRFLAELDVTQLRRENAAWTNATGRVLVATSGVLPERFFGGQTVEVDGFLAAPPQALAHGLFDYREYLRHQGIYFQLRAASTNEWQLIVSAARRPLADRFLAWAHVVLAKGLHREDKPLQLLWSMTLGWRAGITNEIYEPFMQTGTMHIFAISGLHIVLIAAVLVKVLGLLRVPKSWSGWGIIPLIWFYTIATGWQPSAVRATIMMTVIILGWVLKRPSNLLNSLAAAAFIILLWDPHQLFGVSFQLSFLVVLSLALLLPPVDAWARKLFRPDPLLPESLIPKWQTTLRRPVRWILASLATSVAAWAGSLPLCATYFHLFSPVTLLANIVVVPLSSAALACNVGSILVGAAVPPVAVGFNWCAWACMKVIVEFSDRLATPGWLFWYVGGFRWFDFIWYYGLLGLLLLTARSKASFRWFPIALALCGAFYAVDHLVQRERVTITALPLQSGSAIFVHGPRAGDWLIDCGDREAVTFLTRPFLRARGVNRLPHLVLTHGDARHVEGALLIDDALSAAMVHAPPVRFRSPVYKRVISTFQDRAKPVSRVASAEAVGPWRVLHPATDFKFTRADDAALVLLGEFNGTRVLILPDLAALGQAQLLKQSCDMGADVLLVGGQAVDVLSNAELMNRIRPAAVVCFDPESRGFPSRTLSAESKAPAASNMPVLRTTDVGAVKLTISRRGWDLEPMHGKKLAFRP